MMIQVLSLARTLFSWLHPSILLLILWNSTVSNGSFRWVFYKYNYLTTNKNFTFGCTELNEKCERDEVKFNWWGWKEFSCLLFIKYVLVVDSFCKYHHTFFLIFILIFFSYIFLSSTIQMHAFIAFRQLVDCIYKRF